MEMNALFSYVMMLVMVVAFAHSQGEYVNYCYKTLFSFKLVQRAS